MKKLFTFFALSAIVLGMASCGDGNDPEANKVPEGAINGKFTVDNEGKQVYFSRGNLQYNAKQEGKWRFAMNQWDTIATNNQIGKEDYEGWISLFGWGTGENPTNTHINNSYYPSYFYEWGANKISNGGNEYNKWRTLSKEEWTYLFHERDNADNLWGLGYIKLNNNVYIYGVFILPDNWFDIPNHPDITRTHTSYIKVGFTPDWWKANMEAHGAIFLPAEGFREGTTIGNPNRSWYYWSSSMNDENTAYSNSCKTNASLDQIAIRWPVLGNKRTGQSVRLVQDVK